MTHYLIQWSYASDQIQALVDTPHDRASEFKKLVEAFSGRLHAYYFAFGDFDGVAIAEFPDDVTCAACIMDAMGTGAAKTRTTVLLTPEESVEAMRQARAAKHGYMPPVGYSSHG